MLADLLKNDIHPVDMISYSSHDFLITPPFSDEELHDHEESRANAELRARALLMHVLPTSVREAFERDGWITVPSKNSNHVYRIIPNTDYNIKAYTLDGELLAEFCFITKDIFPTSDELCTQYLWVSQNEEEFLREANILPKIEGDEEESSPDSYYYNPNIWACMSPSDMIDLQQLCN